MKTDAGGFVKDESTGVISNQNYNDLEIYKMNRERVKQMQQMMRDINMLKTEMDEIKRFMLNQTNKRENCGCQE